MTDRVIFLRPRGPFGERYIIGVDDAEDCETSVVARYHKEGWVEILSITHIKKEADHGQGPKAR